MLSEVMIRKSKLFLGIKVPYGRQPLYITHIVFNVSLHYSLLIKSK